VIALRILLEHRTRNFTMSVETGLRPVQRVVPQRARRCRTAPYLLTRIIHHSRDPSLAIRYHNAFASLTSTAKCCYRIWQPISASISSMYWFNSRRRRERHAFSFSDDFAHHGHLRSQSVAQRLFRRGQPRQRPRVECSGYDRSVDNLSKLQKIVKSFAGKCPIEKCLGS